MLHAIGGATFGNMLNQVGWVAGLIVWSVLLLEGMWLGFCCRTFRLLVAFSDDCWFAILGKQVQLVCGVFGWLFATCLGGSVDCVC